MSMNLESILRDYAIESGLVDDHEGNPEEITVVTDETVSELEEELQEVANKVSDAKAEVDQIVEASDAIVSVESVIQTRLHQLNDPEFQAEYSRTVQAMSWGIIQDSMEGHGFPKSVIDEMMSDVSYEADEGEGGKEGQAKKDGSKLKAALAKFWAWLKKIGETIKQAWIRFLDLFRTSADKNKRSAAILKKLAGEREATLKKADSKINLGSFKDLAVGGKVDAKGTVRLLEQCYTQNLVKNSDAVADVTKRTLDALNRFVNTGNESGWKTLVNSVNRKIDDVLGKNNAITSSVIVEGFIAELPGAFNFELAGGYKAEYTTSNNGKPAIKFAIKRENEPKDMGESTVPALSEVNEIASAIDDVTKLLGDVQKNIEKSIADTDILIKQATALASKNVAIQQTGNEVPVIQAIITSLQSINNSTRQSVPVFNQHVLKTSHTAYKYGLAVISKYPKKGKVKSEDKAE